MYLCKKNIMEEWRDVPGYEGMYQVSSIGRVKSLERIVKRDKVGWFKIRERILAKHKITYKRSEGSISYERITLNSTKIGKKQFSVHVLMAIAFLNHKPCGFEIVVDHKNNDSMDNRIENLELVSNRENVSKGFLNKRKSSKYTGVCYIESRNQYQSKIMINKKRFQLVQHKDEEYVASFYRKALEESHLFDGDVKKFRELIKSKL